MRYSVLIVCLFCFLIGCNKSTPVVPTSVQLARDIEAIDQYLSDNGITAIQDTTGVRYVVHTLGTGPVPAVADKCIRVNYAGRLMSDNTEFDSNTSYKTSLLGLIAGWRIVFPKLPKGSKATLYVPSVYGYGSLGNGKIPGNANLIFDVEVLDVYEYNYISGYCYDEPLLLPADQLTKDIGIIDQYLNSNGISAQTDPSGIRYTVQSSGTGTAPTLSNCVTIKYTGRLLTGEQFDQNVTGYKAPLKNLIEGLKTGLQLLPKGTKATFYIPSGLAYKTISPNTRIPANANLIFEVELAEVGNYDATKDRCSD